MEALLALENAHKTALDSRVKLGRGVQYTIKNIPHMYETVHIFKVTEPCAYSFNPLKFLQNSNILTFEGNLKISLSRMFLLERIITAITQDSSKEVIIVNDILQVHRWLLSPHSEKITIRNLDRSAPISEIAMRDMYFGFC